jgi:hypothetical protein
VALGFLSLQPVSSRPPHSSKLPVKHNAFLFMIIPLARGYRNAVWRLIKYRKRLIAVYFTE